MNIWNRLPCSAVSHVIPSVDNFHKFAIPVIRVIMVLLSFKFHMNVFFISFCTYCEQLRFIYKLFLHFSLSGCVCVFALLHSSIA